MRISDWSSDVCSSDLPWKSLSLNIRTSDAIAGVAAACGSLRECPMSVPSHVPAELVREFDFFAAPELASAPHREMRRFHRYAPGLFYTPLNGGHWVVNRSPVAVELLRKPRSETRRVGKEC